MQASAQPANDLCSSPEAIPNTAFPVTINGDNTDAGSDVPRTCLTIGDDDLDVWYSLTAAQSGLYTFDCVGGGALLDPTVSLWTDCSTRVACDDNGGGGFNARVSRSLSVGQTVLVRVGASSFFTDIGPFQLTVSLAPDSAANNDTCATATSISSLPFADTRDLFTATADLDTACNDPAATATQNGRWYSYTPASNQVVRFENAGGTANVIIAVFTGSCAAPVSFVCQGGVAIGGVPYGVTCPLTAGVAYRILVGNYTATPLGGSTTVSFTATLISPAANDQCGAATAITALPFADSVDFSKASFDRDVGCNSTFRNTAVTHNGVWYTYTAPGAQQLQFNFDPAVSSSAIVGVFTGSCAAPTEVACLTSFPATFNVAAGTTYRLLVGGAGSLGTSITRTFQVSIPNPPPANDLCTGAIALTAGVAANGDNTNATSTNDGPTPSAVSCQSSIVKSVWYSFTPAVTGNHEVSTCGSTQDTVLTVLSGACGGQTIIGCDDDSCSAPTDFASDIAGVALNAGTTYFIRVSSFNAAPGPTGGPYTVIVLAPTTSGACCRGATCSVDTSTACTGFATLYAGANTVCNSFGVNNSSPCCLADYNHIGGVTVQDIFDFLAGYFSTSPQADINGGGIGVQDIFDFLAAYFTGCA